MTMQRRTAFAAGLAFVALAALSPSTATADRSDPACPGVRPGAVMLPTEGVRGERSWNFLLRGSDGGTYSFVEGKVINPQKGNASVTVHVAPVHVERTWPRGKGPGVSDGSGRAVGHAVWYANDSADEYGLIRLSRGQKWDSRVCGVNSTPNGIDLTISSTPITVFIYGQDNARTSRTHTDVLPYGRNTPNKLPKATPVSSGDWSAPVLTSDNQALGFLDKSFCCQAESRTTGAGSGGTVIRLQPLLDRAGKTLRITLALERATSGVAR